MKKAILDALRADSDDISFDVKAILDSSLYTIPLGDTDMSYFMSTRGLKYQVEDARDTYLAYNFIRKHPGLPGSSDEARRECAEMSFLESEYRCNRWDRSSDLSEAGRQILDYARGIIGSLLCNYDFSRENIVLQGAHGPGATFDLPRSKGDAYYKMGLKPTATEMAARYPFHLVDLWATHVGHEVCLVRGSRYTTVPKDAKTFRGIAIEPTWNMFLQKGLGRILRRALRAWNIDLDTLQYRNRRIARQSSVTGEYATIDLHQASDSISLELCARLLPPDLMDRVLELRSQEINFSGEWRTLWKVSSMGNGFTFELESLIFSALAFACCSIGSVPRKETASYGDDIVIPTEVSEMLVTGLNECGFLVNDSKSFTEGTFRESCGGHYLSGCDVTPIYVKKPIRRSLDKIWLANSLRRWAFHGHYCRDRVKEAYDFVIESLPSPLRSVSSPLWDNTGAPLNISLGGNFCEATPTFDSDVQQYRCKGWAEGRRSRQRGGIPMLAKQLWSSDQSAGTGPRDLSSMVTDAHQVRYFPVEYIHFTQWPDVGEWL